MVQNITHPINDLFHWTVKYEILVVFCVKVSILMNGAK